MASHAVVDVLAPLHETPALAVDSGLERLRMCLLLAIQVTLTSQQMRSAEAPAEIVR
jgi:hypothetical protein